ncbi:hypothetical protein BVI1335_1070002 [Burkholderia vietnamiensis]|nr:hypothetical protein BVI1335_1070002 [Burkholderia vietnamiensis]
MARGCGAYFAATACGYAEKLRGGDLRRGLSGKPVTPPRSQRRTMSYDDIPQIPVRYSIHHR